MRNPNAIVAVVVRTDPPIEKQTAAELLRKHPDGVSVTLADHLYNQKDASADITGRYQLR